MVLSDWTFEIQIKQLFLIQQTLVAILPEIKNNKKNNKHCLCISCGRNIKK